MGAATCPGIAGCLHSSNATNVEHSDTGRGHLHLFVPRSFTPFAYEISSSAIINDDGSLRIKGKNIQLYGIHIPRTDNTCTNYRRPPVCSSRAALALDFKIDGFVRCKIVGETDDGNLVGQCRVNSSKFNEGEDLSAYLLEKGWAAALPDAPFEYHTLEKIAQSRQFGVWGIPVDRIRRP